MSQLKRFYRRVVTTERLTTKDLSEDRDPVKGGMFRFEIFKTDGDGETLVYERKHTGSIEVEEKLNGDFRVTAETGQQEPGLGEDYGKDT